MNDDRMRGLWDEIFARDLLQLLLLLFTFWKGRIEERKESIQ